MSADATPTPTPAAEPLLPTVRSRVVCSCGFVACGRSPEASGDGYRDHITFAHTAAAWPSPATTIATDL
jgi:hypothetical protein